MATLHLIVGLPCSGKTTLARQLEAKEMQIANMAAEGMSNREIAQRLYLSHRTVGSHLYRLFPNGIAGRVFDQHS